MVAYVFDNILTKGVRSGQIPARTQAARSWFRKEAQNTSVTPSRMMKESKSKMVSNVEIGEMYLFNYDPKHKRTLPYYDTFPLIFPIGEAEGGFLGINMHYLPLRMRAQLMDALYSLRSDGRYDENTTLRLSYQTLKAASRFRNFKPTVKHYLRRQVKSRFLKIDSVEWDIALFLPLQRFQKASADKVYRDSRAKI